MSIDIHAAQVKMRELFMKTNLQDIGKKDGGISWERDPEKHRQVAKKLHPAFSARSMKAQEATVQEYIDLFVNRMSEYGGGENGIELKLVKYHAADVRKHYADSRKSTVVGLASYGHLGAHGLQPRIASSQR